MIRLMIVPVTRWESCAPSNDDPKGDQQRIRPEGW